VIIGLLLGKPAGVMLFSWLGVRFRIADLPAGATWSGMHGVAWLAGIGFTMSLFVGSLAFGDGLMLVSAKVGILVASIMAGAIGWPLLTRGPSAGSTDAAATADANAA